MRSWTKVQSLPFSLLQVFDPAETVKIKLHQSQVPDRHIETRPCLCAWATVGPCTSFSFGKKEKENSVWVEEQVEGHWTRWIFDDGIETSLCGVEVWPIRRKLAFEKVRVRSGEGSDSDAHEVIGRVER